MPTSLRIAAQVAVAAEPGLVWRTAVDWSRQREWIWATRVSGGHGTGAEVTGELAGRVIVPIAGWGLHSSLRRFARLLDSPVP
jgi:hypothetical protein